MATKKLKLKHTYEQQNKMLKSDTKVIRISTSRVGYVAIVYNESTPNNKFGVLYDTNFVPSQNSLWFPALEEAKNRAWNIVVQMQNELGAKKVFVFDYTNYTKEE